MSCAALALIVSIASVHLHTDRQYNDFNPGLAGACNRYEAGAYYNSHKKLSLHADYRGDWLIVGVVSGYKPLPIMPEVAVYKDVGPVEVLGMAYPEFDDSSKIRNVAVVLGVRYKMELKK